MNPGSDGAFARRASVVYSCGAHTFSFARPRGGCTLKV